LRISVLGSGGQDVCSRAGSGSAGTAAPLS
jgi:hypothetical protein